jgi:hypothetical protein
VRTLDIAFGDAGMVVVCLFCGGPESGRLLKDILVDSCAFLCV